METRFWMIWRRRAGIAERHANPEGRQRRVYLLLVGERLELGGERRQDFGNRQWHDVGFHTATVVARDVKQSAQHLLDRAEGLVDLAGKVLLAHIKTGAIEER